MAPTRAPATAVLALALLARPTRAQPRRLRIVNGCPTGSMWIAHEAANDGSPDPQNIEIKPGGFFDFATPDGLAATRFWPKMGCDPKGNHCGLGGSGGPGQACVVGDDYSRCAPPVDTKFEATFGRTGQSCTPSNEAGCDFVDVSLVDGFTLPFKLDMLGTCYGSGPNGPLQSIDCSGLSFDQCPTNEMYSEVDSLNLEARNPNTGRRAGCYSPCSKMVMGRQWNNRALGPRTDPRIFPYCCPTEAITAEACRLGPITTSKYVNLVHSACPGVYAYSFDDATGLTKCDPGTQYILTFYCPAEPAVQPTTTPPPAPPAPPTPPPPAACKIGNVDCLGYLPGRGCQCGADCFDHGNCCPDYAPQCRPPKEELLSAVEIISKMEDGALNEKVEARNTARATGLLSSGAATATAAFACLAALGLAISRMALPWARGMEAANERLRNGCEEWSAEAMVPVDVCMVDGA